MNKLKFAQLAWQRLETSIRERLLIHTGLDITRPAFFRCSVTQRCNYKCLYCNHWRRDKYEEEMTFEEWKCAISGIKQFVGAPVIQFVGGEPFVWPHFLELVEFCRSIDVNWGVITNGSALANRNVVTRLVAASPVNIDVSVDGASPGVHDTARGVQGSLARIEAGLRLLTEERAKRGAKFLIRIKPTVHRLNVGAMQEIVAWSKAIGATSVDFAPVSLVKPEDIEKLYIRSTEEFESLAAEIDALIASKMESHFVETSVAKLSGIKNHFIGAPIRHGAATCRSNMRVFSVSPSGDVKSCNCYSTLGNLRVSSAKQIWTSGNSRANRRSSLSCIRYTEAGKAMDCSTQRSLWQDIRRASRVFAKDFF